MTRTYNLGDSLPANYYNADRAEIIAGVNSIDNAQISPTAGILESKILFNGSSGHDHSGGTQGKPVNVSGIPLTGFSVAGLTAGYPIFVNGAGTELESRLILPTDLDPSFLLPEAQVTFDPTGGHIHDGVFSTKVPVVNLNPTGLTPLYYLQVNATGDGVIASPVTGGINNRAFGFYVAGFNVNTAEASWNPIVPENMTAVALYAYIKQAPVGGDLTIRIYRNPPFYLGPVAQVTILAGTNSASTLVIASPALTAGDVLSMGTSLSGAPTNTGQGLSVVLECTQP